MNPNILHSIIQKLASHSQYRFSKVVSNHRYSKNIRNLYNVLKEDDRIYVKILETYNKALKKPTSQMKNLENTTINRILRSDNQHINIQFVSQFLFSLKQYKLIDSLSLDIIQEWIQKQVQNLLTHNKIDNNIISVSQLLNFLVEQGRYFLWIYLSKKLLTFYRNSQVNIDLLINHAYCQSIVFKSLQIPKQKYMNHFSQYFPQQQFLLQLPITINEKIPPNIYRRSHRSPLQIQIQSLLKTNKIDFERQVTAYNFFSVDFKIYQDKVKQKQLFMQVLGNSHYTADGRLKGKDIFRTLLLQKIHKVRFVHEKNFNETKGISNRLNFIKNVIDLHQVNWNP